MQHYHLKLQGGLRPFSTTFKHSQGLLECFVLQSATQNSPWSPQSAVGWRQADGTVPYALSNDWAVPRIWLIPFCHNSSSPSH